MTDLPQIDVAEALRLAETGALLLDVREQDEWDAGHAPMAVHLPLTMLGERHTELPKDRRILAMCRMGGRSASATAALVEAGYDVVNIAGGMQAWTVAGHPVETDDGRQGTVI